MFTQDRLCHVTAVCRHEKDPNADSTGSEKAALLLDRKTTQDLNWAKSNKNTQDQTHSMRGVPTLTQRNTGLFYFLHTGVRRREDSIELGRF